MSVYKGREIPMRKIKQLGVVYMCVRNEVWSLVCVCVSRIGRRVFVLLLCCCRFVVGWCRCQGIVAQSGKKNAPSPCQNQN